MLTDFQNYFDRLSSKFTAKW